jgi:hypothetical protein
MRLLCLAAIVPLMSACTRVEAARQSVQVHMSNVDLHVSDDVTLHIRELRGQFVAVGRSTPYLDDKRTYSVQVDSGEVAIDIPSLNALMARTFGNGRSNVGRLKVSIGDDGTLRQKGVIDSAINVPFQSKSNVSVTPDGRLRVSTTSMKGFGLPMKPILSFFGVEMDDLLKVKPGHGVVVTDNDLILDVSRLLPAPAITGRLSAVRIENNALVQTFGSAAAPEGARPASSRNHIYWRGGELSFGKLTMHDTDLELIDLDPGDPLDFSVDHWQAQLVAGYSKTLPNRGLHAFVPDYNDLGQGRRVREARR